MSIGTWFWVIYFFSIAVSYWGFYDPAQPLWYRRFSGSVVLWVLVGMLGYHAFGPAVKP